MICLSPDAPLRSLLDAARAEGLVSSQANLGARRNPPVKRGVVRQALEKGDGLRLSTLATYAYAAGYVLMLRADRRGCFVGDLVTSLASITQHETIGHLERMQ